MCPVINEVEKVSHVTNVCDIYVYTIFDSFLIMSTTKIQALKNAFPNPLLKIEVS